MIRQQELPAESRTTSRKAARRRRLRAAATVAGFFLASRLWFWLIDWLAVRWLPHAYLITPPGYEPPWTVVAWIRAWANWDGFWYLSIAHSGYADRPLASAFFPLYPLLLKLSGGSVWAGILLSNFAFLVALGLLYALSAAELGERVARGAVAAMAFFPTAFYFGAVYPESLFLALALGAIWAARQGAWRWAGVMGALASATSVYGVLLIAPMLWLGYLRHRRFEPEMAWALGVPAGLIAYMAFLGLRFGHPLLFLSVQAYWGRHLTPLWLSLTAGWHAFLLWLRHLSGGALFAPGYPQVGWSNLYNFLLTALAAGVMLVSVGRLPGYLLVFGALVLAVPLSDPAQGLPWMSMPRLVLPAFPVYMGIGAWGTRHPTWSRLYYGVALPLGALLTALFTTGHWVA